MKQFFTAICASMLLWGCGNGNNNIPTPEENTTPSEPATNQPKVLSYQVVNVFPHDEKCFTEGLQYLEDGFLESAGQNGESDIRYTDLKTGKTLKNLTLDKKYFGEGCTQLNGKVYQMTYQENTCFVYDAGTLKKTGQFTYNFGEGWGMTTNGKELIVSNGGSNLFFIDPTNFRELKRVGVTNEYGPVGRINELELIKGYVYANIWQTNTIVKIDTASGKVVGSVDFTDLRKKYDLAEPTMHTEEYKGPEAMNGIAYDSVKNRIFITGKYWPKLFEVKLDN